MLTLRLLQLPDINGCIIFQLVRIIKNTSAIISTHNGKLSIRTEVSCSDELTGTINLGPESHLFIRYVPQPDLSI